MSTAKDPTFDLTAELLEIGEEGRFQRRYLWAMSSAWILGGFIVCQHPFTVLTPKFVRCVKNCEVADPVEEEVAPLSTALAGKEGSLVTKGTTSGGLGKKPVWSGKKTNGLLGLQRRLLGIFTRRGRGKEGDSLLDEDEGDGSSSLEDVGWRMSSSSWTSGRFSPPSRGLESSASIFGATPAAPGVGGTSAPKPLEEQGPPSSSAALSSTGAGATTRGPPPNSNTAQHSSAGGTKNGGQIGTTNKTQPALPASASRPNSERGTTTPTPAGSLGSFSGAVKAAPEAPRLCW